MPLMSHYIAKVGLTDMCHIIHGAAVSLRTATDIAARIDTLNPDIDLDHQINQLLSIETDLYNIYKTINTILQEQA
ncbi:gp40 [Propionibacterium phage PA6]|uniref:Gp40 n=1 Tax=Propionibacterium phage PA6 TaxID=376758 RepID=A4K4A7_9CAUD|nr:gp40 [Propionibacterium phage PA6]ABE68609.1 gp40 [Propionibacterium phage PA6]